MAKAPNDFDVRPMTVKHVDGKPAFPVVISMPSREVGIAIENEVMTITCEVCGCDITDEYDDGGKSGHCPECDRYLCHACADWENLDGVTMCADCYEAYTMEEDE